MGGVAQDALLHFESPVRLQNLLKLTGKENFSLEQLKYFDLVCKKNFVTDHIPLFVLTTRK